MKILMKFLSVSDFQKNGKSYQILFLDILIEPESYKSFSVIKNNLSMIPTIQSILDPSKGRIDFLRENTQDSWHQ
jgi:hypothetical protein